MQPCNSGYPNIPKPIFCDVHHPIGAEREAVVVIVTKVRHPATLRLESERPMFSRSHPEAAGMISGNAVYTEHIEPTPERISEVLP